MTQACLWVFRLISRMWLSRSESRLHPAPITRVGGKPLCLQATWAMMSTGHKNNRTGDTSGSEGAACASVRSSFPAPTWLWGDDHHRVRAEARQMWDDSSVHVNISLNHAHVRLLTAPSVGSDHDDPGASWGWQIWQRQNDWCLNSAQQQPQLLVLLLQLSLIYFV